MNVLRYINFSPDSDQSSGGDPFASLKTDDNGELIFDEAAEQAGDDTASEGASEEEENSQGNDDETNNDEGGNDTQEEEGDAEGDEKEKESGSEDGGEQEPTADTSDDSDKDESDGDELVFKVPEGSDKKSEDDSLQSWEEVASEFDVKLEEDSLDSFKQGIEGKIQSEVEQKVKEGYIKIDDENPGMKKVLDFVNDGGNLTELLNTGSKYDQYLVLDDASLVKESLKADGYSDEVIESELETMQEKDTLSVTADKVRTQLKNTRESEINSLIEKFEVTQEDQKVAAEKAKKETDQAVHNAIDKIDTFMGGKVTDDVRAFVKKAYDSGSIVEEIDKDPDAFAQVLMFKAIGEQLAKSREQESFDKGKGTFRNKLSNTPQKDGGNKKGTKTTAKRDKPQAEGLEGFNKFFEDTGVTPSV